MTTIYIVGNGAGSITPPSSATWQLYLTVSGASAVFNVFLIYRSGP